MDLLDRDALDLSALLEQRKVSAAEVMAATLTRIGQANPRLNAIVAMADPDALMAEARAADAAPRKGWLHGIPIAIKDLANAKGFRTSMGSPIFANQPAAASDDVMVGRIRAAGAIVIGKTNTPEFGLGSHTFNPVHGATGNAYDPARSAGGSSGGAAVALAARMLAVADGSDMMGSLRNPAGWNNVYGFRPSWGVVPSEPLGDMFLHQLATNGPMARSPADVAALLETQGGRDWVQPHGLDLPDLANLSGASLKGKRIGFLGDWGGAYPMEDGILDLCRAALAEMEAQGAIVEEIAPPFPAERIWDSWATLRSWAVAANSAPLYHKPETRALLKPAAIWEIENGLRLTAMEVHAASVARSEWYRAAARLFQRFDALALPSAQVWPFPVEWVSPQTIAGRTMDTYHRWMEVVIPVSLLGLPALCVPVGFGQAGLPMGLQLVGPSRADRAILQMGQAWHEATGWPARRPPA